MFKPCQKRDTLPIKCLARFLPWCTSAAKAIEAEQEKEAHRGAQWVETVGYADGFGLLEETRKSPRPPQNWLFDAICNLWIPVIFHGLGSKGWCKILLDNPSFYTYSWTKVVFLTESSEGTRHVFQAGSGFLSQLIGLEAGCLEFHLRCLRNKTFCS